MCRRNHLLGCSICAFGLGILIGHSISSGFWCFWGGMALLFFGFCTVKKR